MSICSTHSSGEAPRRHGVEERVQVDHDEVERLDAEARELRRGASSRLQVGEDARVHGGVQGLHPPVERLGEAGELD